MTQSANKLFSSILTTINIEILGDFLLPKEELGGKLLMIEYQSQYIINIPMVMRNGSVYRRAIYVLSVAIKVKKEQFSKNQDAYFEIVRKLAYVISQLEVNRNYIYRNDENKEEIHTLIKQIYQDINISAEHESFVEFDDSQYMFLRLPQQPQPPQNIIIKYSQVPFPIVNIKQGVQTAFNPILEKLIPEINGINCVGAICQKLKEFKAEQIKTAIKEMIEYNLIRLVDMIKITNMYVINENFFTHDFKQEDILQIVNTTHEAFLQKFGQSFDFDLLKQYLQTLYIEMKRGLILKDYIENNKTSLEFISLTKLIRYGQLNNFLNRVHEYFFICASQIQKAQNLENIFLVAPSNYIKMSERFNEEDKNSKEQQEQQMECSLEYSKRFEKGIEGQFIGQKLKDDEKLKDANETIKNMIFNQETLDEICLVFNLDLEQCHQLVESKEYVIIHK
ncbi:unnamed protein product [Paramecium octaurelia]|uniref:Uncharacterized protein n=1 Tax=Paramecium octaurelia TaxID=43137 RepID=A0A8S1YCN8_PAROT|nr:unnamed protein product [Paramecium octaurelia]